MTIVIAVVVTAATMLLIALPVGIALLRRLDRLGRRADALRQQSNRQLASADDERDRLIAALNSSVDAVLALDREGDIAFANSAAERLFERSQSDLLGRPFAFLMPNEEVRDALRASADDGQPHTALIDQPGRTYLRVFTTPLATGEWSALVVIDDLTDVKRTEQVRRDFVANVSHELRTPLASLKSVVETLESGALEDEAATRDFLSRAQGEIDRMVQIMEELLELSRIESGEVPMAKEPLDVSEVLVRAVERLQPQARRQGVQLSLEAGSSLPPVVGDAERLERAALNLIHNALKFTPAGGAVRVEAQCEDGAVVVHVRDTGVGIAPADLPRVFERFYKVDRARSTGGTGLGLAIVKHTVEAHGGTVVVESQQGGGSVFSFSLPAAPSP
jgi:two-component system phosphate regulon sensor histidine kinase PhoR